MITDIELKEAALRVLGNAYSPYSNIGVAAAVLTNKGNVYTGVNIENSSYGLTVCAERNAIAAAISSGERDFIRMTIVTDSELVKSPCGSCRQVIFEFNKNMPIEFFGPGGYHRSFNSAELLPEGFEL